VIIVKSRAQFTDEVQIVIFSYDLNLKAEIGVRRSKCLIRYKKSKRVDICLAGVHQKLNSVEVDNEVLTLSMCLCQNNYWRGVGIL